MAQNPVVTFEMNDGSVIKAELYPEIAPNTVNNFISLVKKGYYDGLIFHRVIEGFMIQGLSLIHIFPSCLQHPFKHDLNKNTKRRTTADRQILLSILHDLFNIWRASEKRL